MSLIDEALEHTTDTKACIIGAGATDGAASMFRELFPRTAKAVIVEDPNTMSAAGRRIEDLFRSVGIARDRYVICPGGERFHAVYGKVEEVRDAIAASGGIPVAVGSGTINDLVKRASEELGVRYMVVGTAASMDGYTSFGAAITKDGMKQTLDCKAPLGCIVDSEIAASAPKEMTASGYADLIAKIPAGADWILADAIGSERIHQEAWRFVQGPLRESLSDPAGAASGDIREIEKLCTGLVMSGFAMQAMGSSRPASGTEHQVSHYWDMEDLSVDGVPVSHGFKVGIGTLISTKTIEFLLRRDITGIDAGNAVSRWWPDVDSVTARFSGIFGNRPAHIRRATEEYPRKFPSRDRLREELTVIRENWPELSSRIRAQIIPFEEVRENLKKAGAPYEPEMIGITRERLRETYRGVPYMRARYFALDLVDRLGLTEMLLDELFGPGGVWEIRP